MVAFGRGPADLPFHRFGTGQRRLVLIPGVMDSLGWNTPRRLTAELLARYYFRSYRAYDVWVLSRPPGLRGAETVTEMAAMYEDALEAVGPSAVMGMSLGGYVAAILARESPHVEKLVLVGCGTTLGDSGRQTVRRWRALASNRAYGVLHLDYARTVYAGWRGHVLPPLYRLGARWLPEPAVPGDVETSCDAVLSFEGEELFEDVSVPTLVVGGDQDELVPVANQRDAATLFPDGRQALFAAGHAVYEERRSAVSKTVTAFLDA